MAKLYQKLMMHDNEFDAWLESVGLLHSKRTCECGKEMKIRQKLTIEMGHGDVMQVGVKKNVVICPAHFLKVPTFYFFKSH